MYQSGDKRVLFKGDGAWKIGNLETDLDCKTLSGDGEEEYWRKEIPKNEAWFEWTNIKNIDQNGYHITKSWIKIKGFNKGGEITDFTLAVGTQVDAKKKKDCFGKNWGKEYPEKHIVVAFQNANCCDQNNEEEKNYKNHRGRK